MMKDFFAATEGHPTVVNFSTMPAWLFKTDKPVAYPADPNQVAWNYTQGTELLHPSGKELGEYYSRLVSWYVNGGFTDENGIRHDSGYHYKIPVWEVLNELEGEHSTTPEQYTERYDAIVEGIRSVSPDTKFMGMALEAPETIPTTSSTSSIPPITRQTFPSITSPITSMQFPRPGKPFPIGSTPTSIRSTASSPRSAISRTSVNASRRKPRPIQTS